MITKIGLVAGQILNLVEEQKAPVGVLEIKFTIDEPIEFINMAIGWLVREKLVRVISQGDENYLIQMAENLTYASNT